MALTDAEYELLTYIEMEFSVSGLIPSIQACKDRLGITDGFHKRCFEKPTFKRALLNRGINLEMIERSNGVITAQQMMVVNTLLDRNDTRSDKKKLADLRVPSQTYQGWCKDPAFHAYVSARCEALFPNMLNEAHRALNDTVARGDLGAIKLVYEMTGRYSDKKASDLNIDFLLMKILETIQKHVTDPLTLEAIATDLSIFTEHPAPGPVAVAAPLARPALLPVTTPEYAGL